MVFPSSNRKNFFWSGLIILNDTGAHTFFDVKLKIPPDDTDTATLYTSDVPPLLIKKEDTLRVQFILENCVGITPLRCKVTETLFNGSGLDSIEEVKPGNIFTFTSSNSEWQFFRQDKITPSWLLHSISVKIPLAQIKRFFNAQMIGNV